ncbi:MAG: hypothetical protein A3J79_12485 [Elusimicrobia bacterium RIFOXYB2_FULL_62_6]|nr:MAG: hypothetical protein A3J79_12485 [Elusimicrobia bacterium RIFOXYB2_FULL_62_6]
MLSAALAIAGAAIIAAAGWTGIGYAVGLAMCVAAFAAGAYALSLSTELFSIHRQTALGTCYMLGSGLAMAGATLAMMGNAAMAMTAMVTWAGAGAGLCILMGMMIG